MSSCRSVWVGGHRVAVALLCSLAANYLSTCRAPAASQITLIDCARAGVCVPVSMCVCIWYCYTETVTAVSTLPGQRELANFSIAANELSPFIEQLTYRNGMRVDITILILYRYYADLICAIFKSIFKVSI